MTPHVDDVVDRPGVEAVRAVELTGTNGGTAIPIRTFLVRVVGVLLACVWVAWSIDGSAIRGDR